MKNLVLPAAFALLATTPALAGSTEALVFQAPEVVAAAQTDWSGFYAGGMVNFDSAGPTQFYNDGVPSTSFLGGSATSFGGFTGYNFQSGNFVYGAELAVSSGGVGGIPPYDLYFETIFDLKARAGYSFGDVLAYGVVGGAFSNLHAGLQNYPNSGFLYGAGIEYSLSEHLFVGAEYLARELSGTHETNPLFTNETTIQSAQLRVGWKF